MSHTVRFEKTQPETGTYQLKIQLRDIDGQRSRVVTDMTNPNGTHEITDEVFEDFDSAILHQNHLVQVSLDAAWRQLGKR